MSGEKRFRELLAVFLLELRRHLRSGDRTGAAVNDEGDLTNRIALIDGDDGHRKKECEKESEDQ